MYNEWHSLLRHLASRYKYACSPDGGATGTLTGNGDLKKPCNPPHPLCKKTFKKTFNKTLIFFKPIQNSKPT